MSKGIFLKRLNWVSSSKHPLYTFQSKQCIREVVILHNTLYTNQTKLQTASNKYFPKNPVCRENIMTASFFGTRVSLSTALTRRGPLISGQGIRETWRINSFYRFFRETLCCAALLCWQRCSSPVVNPRNLKNKNAKPRFDNKTLPVITRSP